ncbi:MAG: LysR family transcriptional regulator [Myxococcota bacterium]
MQPIERWDDLRLVLAIERHASLKTAAANLGLNVSTVSRRLDALETRLGHRLFDRSPDGTLPTAAAETLVPFAQAMEQAVADGSRALEGFESAPEGVVRIAAPPGLADYLLAPSLARLCDRYPGLKVELVADIGYADLARHEADLALRTRRPQAGDLVTQRLGEASYVVAAATDRPIRKLKDVRWITYCSDLDHLPETAWILDQVPSDRIVLRSNSFSAQLNAARAGLGAVLIARPYLASAGLHPVPVLQRRVRRLPVGALWLAGHRALRDVPRIAATWDFLRDEWTRVIAS